MTRFDSEFCLFELEEKQDPTERLQQAFDECKINGNFRKFLEACLPDIWQDLFIDFYNGSDTSKLNQALRATHPHHKNEEKAIAFLCEILSFPGSGFLTEIFYLAEDRQFNDAEEWVKKLYRSFVAFAKSIAVNFYPKTPFLFFLRLEKECKIPLRLKEFTSLLYGEEYWLSSEFFMNQSLALVEDEDKDLFLARTFFNLPDFFESSAIMSVINRNGNSELNKPAQALMSFFDTLEVWIKRETEVGHIRDYSILKWGFQTIFSSLNNEIISRNVESSTDNNKIEAANQWVLATEQKLKLTFYQNFNLDIANDIEIEIWCEGINEVFIDAIYLFQSKEKIIDLRESAVANYEYFIAFCAELSPNQQKKWLEWSIIQHIKNPEQSDKIHLNFSPSKWKGMEKWCGDKHLPLCKKIFSEHLLNSTPKLHPYALKTPTGHWIKPVLKSEFYELCDQLFCEFFEERKFADEMLPTWTIQAASTTQIRDRLEIEQLKACHLESISIIRNKLARTKPDTDELKKLCDQLKALLSNINPHKEIKQRLMLIRSSSFAFSDESLSVYLKDGCNDAYRPSWYSSLRDVSYKFDRILWENDPNLCQEQYADLEKYALEEIAKLVADFCLSRLKLKKGETFQSAASQEYYLSSQMVERLPYWRSCYLKILQELGIGFNGKTRKSALFILNHDPDEGVRNIANECLGHFKRNKKRNLTKLQLAKTLLAAEWWLLFTQRKELDLPINTEKAINVRRESLRRCYVREY